MATVALTVTSLHDDPALGDYAMEQETYLSPSMIAKLRSQSFSLQGKADDAR